MTLHRGQRLAAVVGAAVLAVLGMAPAAHAGTPVPTTRPATGAAPEATVSVGDLLLEPSAAGYHGTLAITIQYRGKQEAYLDVSVTEPVAGSWRRIDSGGPCFWGDDAPRYTMRCGVMSAFRPGERRTLHVDFEVLTTARDYPMSATGGRAWAYRSDSQPSGSGTPFSTVFRSTSGSTAAPRPYVPDTLANASLTADASVVLNRQSDGSYLGWLPVTVRWNGDVAHSWFSVPATLPAGVELWGIDGADARCFGTICDIAERYMQGTEHSYRLKLQAPAGTVPGDLGTGAVDWRTHYVNDVVADVSPADNTASFRVTLAG